MIPAGVASGYKIIEQPQVVEAALWRRLRYEDETACREALFDIHFETARVIALYEFRRRPAYGLERRDFEQLAYGGLLEAIDRFDPLRGTPFKAFAQRRIKGAISDGLARSSESGAQYAHRRRTENERLRSLGSDIAPEEGDYLAELSQIAAGLAIGFMAENAGQIDADAMALSPLGAYEAVSWRDLQLSVLREIDRLPDIERSVMKHHYLNGIAFTHIAGMLGLSKGRISQIHRAAIAKIRASLQSIE